MHAKVFRRNVIDVNYSQMYFKIRWIDKFIEGQMDK